MIFTELEPKARVIPAGPVFLTGKGRVVGRVVARSALKGDGAIGREVGIGILKGKGDGGGVGAIALTGATAITGAKRVNLKIAKG